VKAREGTRGFEYKNNEAKFESLPYFSAFADTNCSVREYIKVRQKAAANADEKWDFIFYEQTKGSETRPPHFHISAPLPGHGRVAVSLESL